MFIRLLHRQEPDVAPMLGVDLGTTNVVASVGGAALDLGESSVGRVVLPSVVAHTPSGATLVGAPARARRVIDPENTLFSTKRILGRAWDSPQAEEFRRRYPFTMQKADDGGIALVTRGGRFSPTDVAAILLRHVVLNLPRSVDATRAAIAVPATFTPAQRAATEAAARQAGLQHVVLLEEPLAAAHAYAGRFQPGLVAVYDLGGGTFDFSILDIRLDGAEVLANDGDPFLGGDDLDHALAQWAVLEVLRLFRVDLRTDREATDRLVQACEQAKVRLSVAAEAHIDLSQVDPAMLPEDATLAVDGLLLQRLAGDLVRRSFVLCEDVLRRIGKRPADISDVVLAGGSTQLPLVRAGVERFFGRRPRSEVSPTQVVSIGTGLAGRALMGA